MAPLYSDCGWWPFGWGKVEANLPNPCDTATMSFDGAKCVSTITGESFCDPSTTKFEQGKCISSVPSDTTMTGESFCDPLTSSVPSDDTSNKCTITIKNEGPKKTAQADGTLVFSEWGTTKEPSKLFLKKYDVEPMWIGSNQLTNGEYDPSKFEVTMRRSDDKNYECCMKYKRSDDKTTWAGDEICTGDTSTYTYTSDTNAYAVFATFYARPK